MLQGDGLNGKAVVLEDHLLLLWVYRMEHHLETEMGAEKAHLSHQHLLEFARRIDVQGCRSPLQPERAYHSDEPEAVVSVNV